MVRGTAFILKIANDKNISDFNNTYLTYILYTAIIFEIVEEKGWNRNLRAPTMCLTLCQGLSLYLSPSSHPYLVGIYSSSTGELNNCQNTWLLFYSPHLPFENRIRMEIIWKEGE